MTLVHEVVDFAKSINIEIIVLFVVAIVCAAIIADVWTSKR